MNKYEVTFIFQSDSALYEEGLAGVRQLFSESGVKITDENDLGDKKLAYQIKKNERGHYYLFFIEASGETISKLCYQFNLSTKLLKYMFVKIEAKAERMRARQEKARAAFIAARQAANTAVQPEQRETQEAERRPGAVNAVDEMVNAAGSEVKDD